MSNIYNMIQAAKSSNPSGFAKAFTTELRDRLGSALAERRSEVVGGMFGISEEVDPDEGQKAAENKKLKPNNGDVDGDEGTYVKESEVKMCKCGKMPFGKCNCDKKGM